MPRRLHRWIEIGGWTLGSALGAGELRAFCPRPDCEHMVRFRPSTIPEAARLFEIARRMRCGGCARVGANIEIWTRDVRGAARRANWLK
jgi:hypothetical protein